MLLFTFFNPYVNYVIIKLPEYICWMITKIIEALCQTYKFRNGLVQHTLRLNLIAQLLYSLQVTANESHYSCLSPRKQN